jgi:hypothetical protein
MAITNITDLYEQYIKPLPEVDQLRLIELISRKLTISVDKQPKQRSLLELEGLGADLWQGIEAQEYVHKLRQEWDQRP